MLEIRRMSWEDFKKKKKKTLLNREAAIFTRRSIARAYMMSFWIEVRSSAHSQVLCLTAVLKKKRGLELWDRSGSEQTFLYCCKHQTDLQIIAQLMHNLELLRNTDVRDHRSANLGLHFKKSLKISSGFLIKLKLQTSPEENWTSQLLPAITD